MLLGAEAARKKQAAIGRMLCAWSHRAPIGSDPGRSPVRDMLTGLARRRSGSRRIALWHPLAPSRYIASVPRLQRKGFGRPDEVRRFPNGVVEVVTLDELNVSRFVFQPGWRWKADVGPIAGTES